MSDATKKICGIGVVVALACAMSFTTFADAQEIVCADYANYAGRLTPAIADACGSPKPVVNIPAGQEAATDPAMGVDIYGDEQISWILNDYPGYTVVVASTLDSYAMDFDIDGTTLWAMNNLDQTLGTVDLVTGVITAFNSCPPPDADPWSGLTIDPSTGDVYASSVTDLYSIDNTNPAGCNSTLIGSFGTAGGTVIEIAMNGSGQMYAHDIIDDALYSVDPATGAATAIGATGYDGNYAQGMDFDHDTGELYACLLTASTVEYYGTFDLATGAFNSVYTNPVVAEHEFSVQLPGVPVELQSFSIE